MAIIQKRADELKPGDVVTMGKNGKCSFLYASREAIADEVRMQFGAHNGWGLVTHMLNCGEDTVFHVESPDLTPAQQHAEELAEALQVMMNCHAYGAELYDDYRAKYIALLDKIKPPTLAEALGMLEKIRFAAHLPAASIDIINGVDAMLDRARRAGVMP